MGGRCLQELRNPTYRQQRRTDLGTIGIRDLHLNSRRGARYSQLSKQPCCGCVLQARALPRNSAAVAEWAAAAATARAAEVETALEETARDETGAAAETAKGDDETARRHKTLQQDGSRGSTTR